jgi:hypothetical protein
VRPGNPAAAVVTTGRTGEDPRGCPRLHVPDTLGRESLRYCWMHGCLLVRAMMVMAIHW